MTLEQTSLRPIYRKGNTVCITFDEIGNKEYILYNLSDYIVTSVMAGCVWLVKI